MPQALLALDLGTTRTRARAWLDGCASAPRSRPLDIALPTPSRAEQDPRQLVERSADAIEEVLRDVPADVQPVLGLATQRSTVVLWDGESGRALGPALSWRDSRASAQAERLARDVPELERLTGLPPSPHYGAPKLRWALECWPEARRALEAGRLRCGPVASWLLWKLTQAESFAVDPTNAQRMQLLDVGRLRWSDRLIEAAGLDRSCLPELRPTDGDFGVARVAGRRLPVRTLLGDQQAAMIGLGPLDGPAAGVQLGTGGFVLRDTGEEARHVPGLLVGLARADTNRPRRHLVEGPVNAAGSAFDRLREVGLLRPDEDLDATCRAASRPATVVPAWGGLAAPWWAPGARAAVHGWSESTTRADLVAGTARGLAFLVAGVVDRMREHGLGVSRLVLSGPLAHVGWLAQSIADAAQLPVEVRTNPEATLEGVAVALAEASEAEPPEVSVQCGARHEAGRDPTEEREAFRAAVEAALRLAQASAGEGAEP